LMLVVYGVLHGAPQSGNFFVMDDWSLAIFDFGIVGRLDQETMSAVVDLFVGVTRRDTDRVVRGLIRLGALGDDVDLRPVRRDLEDLIDRHYGKPLKQLELGPLVQEVLQLAHPPLLRRPPGLLLRGKALVTTDGV